MRTSNLIFFLFIPAIIVTGLVTFLVTNYFQDKTNVVVVPDRTAERPANGERLRFFQDSLIVTSMDINDPHRLVLEVDLNRKETVKDVFTHYYTANLFRDGDVKKTKTNFRARTEVVEANDFLPRFENKLFDDLSTRETYSFALNFGDKELQLDLRNLNGDFFTKNSIDYTRYLSVGDGTLTMDGQTIPVSVALEKIYSADHSHYLFFPGVDDLSSATERFLVWDEEGGFYLVDHSTVSADSPFYRPHTWVLYKNAKDLSAQKFFEGTVTLQEQGATKNWEVTIPELNTTLRLSTDDPTNGVWTSGTVHGTALNIAGEKPVFGSFSWKKE